MGAAGWDCCAAQFGGWSIPPAQPGQDLFGALAWCSGALIKRKPDHQLFGCVSVQSQQEWSMQGAAGAACGFW